MLIDRLRLAVDAGTGSSGADARILVDAIEDAVMSDGDLERVLGLRAGWAARERRRQGEAAVRALMAQLEDAGASERAAAAEVSLRVRRYVATRYPGDRRKGRAQRPEDAELFRIAQGLGAQKAETMRKQK